MMPSSEATSAAQTVATAERVDTTRPSILQDGPVTNVTPLSTANEGSSTTAILQAGPTSSTSSPTGTVKNEAEGAAVIQSTEPAIVTTTLVQETVSEADASPTIKPNEVVPTISDTHSTKVTITQTEATTTSSDQSDRTTVMTLQSESEISGFTNTVSPIPTQAEVTSTQLPFVPSSTANQTKGTTQTTQGVPGPVFDVTPDTPPSNHTVSPLTEKDLADSTEGMMMTQKTSTDVAITSVGTVVKPSGTTTPYVVCCISGVPLRCEEHDAPMVKRGHLRTPAHTYCEPAYGRAMITHFSACTTIITIPMVWCGRVAFNPRG